MDNRYISVKREALTSTLDAIGDAVEAIDTALDRLETHAGVLRGNWNGEAREAFDEAHAKWDVSLRQLTAIAAAMNAVARSSNTRVHDQDRRDARVWRV